MLNSMKKAGIYNLMGFLLLLGLAFLLWREPALKKSQAGEERRKMVESFVDPTQRLGDLAASADIPYDKVLEDFKVWARYPQDSRPLAADHGDVLDFDKIELPLIPMPIVAKGEAHPPMHACVLQPQAHSVYENQSLEIHLRCQEIATNKFAFADVRRIKLTRAAGVRLFDVPAPEMVKKPEAASIVFLYKPRKQDWGDMELTVDFVLPEEKPASQHTLKVHFFSSPESPAEFTGRLQERLENGSLVISAELKVRLAGTYRVEGHLIAQSGEPIAHARTDKELGGGMQWVDLLFFGKIFRDKGISGPYKLAALYGEQQNLPINPNDLVAPPDTVAKLLGATEQTEPVKRSIIPWVLGYETFSYPLKNFSDREYDSEFKRERIAELERLAREPL